MKRRSIIFAVAAVALTSLLAASALASTTALSKPLLKVKVTGKGRVTSKPGGIACPRACSVSVRSGATVKLTARPAKGWKFARWTGACKGKGSCSVKLTSSKSVGAVFTKVAVSPPPPPPPPPPPTMPPPAAIPGHYNGTTADNELWAFDIGSDGLTLTNLQTGQMNESCTPNDITLSGGNITIPGPVSVALDGSFGFTTTLTGTISGNPLTETLAITGKAVGGTASGTYHLDTSFSLNGTAYGCTTGDQTWTAAKQ